MKALYFAYRFLTRPRVWRECNPCSLIAAYCQIVRKRTSLPKFVEALVHTDSLDTHVCLDLNSKLRGKLPLFALVRALKPHIVIETGVGAGYSSAFILEGLRQNGFGVLYSIDKSDAYDASYYGYPKNFSIGDAVPEHLRKGWTVLVGGSENDLVPLLKRLGQIDMFVHDSLHTREMALFEYESAWRYLRVGGLLISHDIWRPWFDFCKKVDRATAVHDIYGGIRK